MPTRTRTFEPADLEVRRRGAGVGVDPGVDLVPAGRRADTCDLPALVSTITTSATSEEVVK